jgi:hypothetical protein
VSSNRTGGVSENTSANESFEREHQRQTLSVADRLTLKRYALRLEIERQQTRITLNQEAIADHLANRATKQMETDPGYLAGWNRRIAEAKDIITHSEAILAQLNEKATEVAA